MHLFPKPATWTVATYDGFTAATFLGCRQAAYRRLALDAGIGSGDRVLDLGSGPGTLTRAAADLAGSSGQVIGLDRSPEMVIHAQRLGGDSRVGDVARPPFADNSFDIVHLGAITVVSQHAICKKGQEAAFVVVIRTELIRLDNLDWLQRRLIRL